ncbi:MAG: 2-hydroxyacid dehydrogenase [Opitutales bacterium]
MNVAFFNAKKYDRRFFDAANRDHRHEITYVEARLDETTAPVANGFDAVCAFVNDALNESVLQKLHEGGVRFVALRCSGFNNVDLHAAKALGIRVARVPAYSPEAVAEHVLALLLTMFRKTHRAHNRVREQNFSLEGMVGKEVHGSTVGIVGTGRIGCVVAKLLAAFDCALLAYDVREVDDIKQLGGRYVELPELLAQSDIVTLHAPLTPQTKHLINPDSLRQMKRGATLVNTSRGGLVDSEAAYQALKTGQLGHLLIDVYEEESDLFFEDKSSEILQDDLFLRLKTLPNVFITGHQAFFTENALQSIAATTLDNLTALERDATCQNLVESKV